jgi:peptidoglycan/LPS O-acetylase OafA/YrhL
LWLARRLGVSTLMTRWVFEHVYLVVLKVRPARGQMPFAQVGLVVALTRDAGLSWTARLLRLPGIDWLGNVSYVLYMVRERDGAGAAHD